MPTGSVPAPRPLVSSPPVSTGIPRLDDLLRGGLPRGAVWLVRGPPFTGKEAIARRFLLQGVREGSAAALLTSRPAGSVVGDMLTLDPDVAPRLGRGLRLVDASPGAGADAEPTTPGTVAVPQVEDLVALSAAVDRALAGLEGPVRVVLDDLAPLALAASFPSAWAASRRILGTLRRRGVTTLAGLTPGALHHHETEAFRLLADGGVETRLDGGRTLLRSEGFGKPETPWVEHRAEGMGFELVGSFATRRVQ